ncbi:MAG: hypothetical protein BroJett003_04120 [Planctomycetota bacterium]|nr:MAG: hypothetical protein BroJett003_04120 [Planctomycetota bacterium]
MKLGKVLIKPEHDAQVVADPRNLLTRDVAPLDVDAQKHAIPARPLTLAHADPADFVAEARHDLKARPPLRPRHRGALMPPV